MENPLIHRSNTRLGKASETGNTGLVFCVTDVHAHGKHIWVDVLQYTKKNQNLIILEFYHTAVNVVHVSKENDNLR